MHQQLSKYAEINMHIKSREFNLQYRRYKESRRSKCDRCDSNDDAKEVMKNIHFNEKSKLHEQINMISVSAKLLFIMLMMMMLILLYHSH